MRIAVAGGTGLLGKHVVHLVNTAGDEAVVLARSKGIDLTTGTGLDAALDGVDAVVDVTNVVSTRAARSIDFFEAATTNLLGAEKRRGVAHHVALSIVGSDRVDFGYYLGKRRQEELVLGSDVGSTVLRATQFHEFAEQMLARRGPIVLVPQMLCQPIAAREVAAHLLKLARSRPSGLAPELAGPEEHLNMNDMARRLSRAQHGRRPVVSIRLPGKVGRQMARGDLLPIGPGPRGTVTFATWLGARSTEQAPQ